MYMVMGVMKWKGGGLFFRILQYIKLGKNNTEIEAKMRTFFEMISKNYQITSIQRSG